MFKRIVITGIFAVTMTHAMDAPSLERASYRLATAFFGALLRVAINVEEQAQRFEQQTQRAIQESLSEQQNGVHAQQTASRRDPEETVNATCCGQPVLIQWIESLEECPHCGGNMAQDQASSVATSVQQERSAQQAQPTAQTRGQDDQKETCGICCEERNNWIHGRCAHKVCTECGPKIQANHEYRDGISCLVTKCPFCRTDWTIRYQ